MHLSVLRRRPALSALFMIAAAAQLVLAPALRLCDGTHHPAEPAPSHTMVHGATMAHGAEHHTGHGARGNPANPGSPAPQGDDQCLIMRGCDAIAVAVPLLAAATEPAPLPWPTGDIPMPESVDRAPDAPPPRA